MFDPYHRWLAIPKGQRPPTYYQLLGVAPDEEADIIAEAALRQTNHVRNYQTGPHAEQCTALLNEIAKARATLLSPSRRKEYDARLGQVAAPPPVSAEPSEALAAPSSFAFADLPSKVEKRRLAVRQTGASVVPAALAYVAIVLLGSFLAYRLTSTALAPPTGAVRPAAPERGGAGE